MRVESVWVVRNLIVALLAHRRRRSRRAAPPDPIVNATVELAAASFPAQLPLPRLLALFLVPGALMTIVFVLVDGSGTVLEAAGGPGDGASFDTNE